MSFRDKLPSWFNRKSTEELGAIFGAVDNELAITFDDILKLKEEFNMNTSTTIWLDEHGSWYGIERKTGETDESYRSRIWKEILRARVTIPAIESAISELLREDDYVKIEEPYNVIFKLNISELDGDHMLRDGLYISHNIIHIIVYGDIPEEAYAMAEDIKASGVKVYFITNKDFGGKPLDMLYESLGYADYHIAQNLQVKLSDEDSLFVNTSLIQDDEKESLLSGKQYIFMDTISSFEIMGVNSHTVHVDSILKEVTQEMFGDSPVVRYIFAGSYTTKETTIPVQSMWGLLFADSRVDINHPHYYNVPKDQLSEDLEFDITIDRLEVDKVVDLGIHNAWAFLTAGSVLPIEHPDYFLTPIQDISEDCEVESNSEFDIPDIFTNLSVISLGGLNKLVDLRVDNPRLVVQPLPVTLATRLKLPGSMVPMFDEDFVFKLDISQLNSDRLIIGVEEDIPENTQWTDTVDIYRNIVDTLVPINTETQTMLGYMYSGSRLHLRNKHQGTKAISAHTKRKPTIQSETFPIE